MAIGTDRSYNWTDNAELARLRLYAGIKAGDTTFDTELKEMAAADSAIIDQELARAGEGTLPIPVPTPIIILTAEAKMAGGKWKETRWSKARDQPRAVGGTGADVMIVEGSQTRRDGRRDLADYIKANYTDDPSATNPVGIFETIENTPRWK